METKKKADILISFINDAILETELDPEHQRLIREYIDCVFKDGYQSCLYATARITGSYKKEDVKDVK
jgi:hypothetical protein